MKSSIVNNQIAFFVKKTKEMVYEQLILDIRESIKEKFISPSIILPVPEDAPPEIPRVILETHNKKIKIIIAKNRCDFLYNFESNHPNSKLWTNIIEYANKLAEVFNNKGFLFNRIGIVTKYFVVTENPVEIIKKSLTKLRDRDIIEISIRINRRKQYNGFDVNDVHSYDQAIKVKDNDKKQGILITRDINTIYTEKTILSINDIKDFIKNIIDKIKKEDPVKELNND